MSKAYFVTGTDTDAGKTLIASALLYLAGQQGYQTLGLKPVAAGVTETPAGVFNDDALLLQQYSSVKLDYSQVNPVLLREPVAPHIAAAKENRRLNIDRLLGFTRGALSSSPSGCRPDLCLIEGAGGWRVPLSPVNTMADLARALGFPVVIVVGLKLGCLNHALLTAEAVRRDGLAVAGWVATVVDPTMAVIHENLETLKSLLPFPCLGCVPWLESVSTEKVAEYLDLSVLVHAESTSPGG